MMDLIPAELFVEMKRKNIAYDPTLTVYQALADLKSGNPKLLNRSLIDQVGPADLIESTRAQLSKGKHVEEAVFQPMLDRLDANLRSAYQSGVMLITGSDAGNMLVLHGPTVQEEMELWVRAGIPPAVALQAATFNAARALRADNRIGLIQKDREATFILLDGDPVKDISVTEHINAIYFRGERVDRTGLFTQDNQ